MQRLFRLVHHGLQGALMAPLLRLKPASDKLPQRNNYKHD